MATRNGKGQGAGGGGLGMTVVRDDHGLASALATARGKAERFFGDPAVYIEKFISTARHVEVQVLGLSTGEIVVVGDRDCTVQRRNQKVLEEAPSPGLTPAERARLHHWAKSAAARVSYRGAGTVEMIMDLSDRSFYFLEMNTRLQVEHPVTEMVAGLDLVEAQLCIAQGQDSHLTEFGDPQGHAIDFRVYAEDPERFMPGPGAISEWREPSGPGIRVDRCYACYEVGDIVSPYYDPLMAKLCVHAEHRAAAIAKLAAAAGEFVVKGPRSNLPLARRIARDGRFLAGSHDTSILASLKR